ncbi:MAG: anti-sigma F factor [Firmicutes bacterium]|nr:anti-sigma F factor [Bacillota bacterium]
MPEQSATRSDNFVQLTFLSKPENVAFARVAIAAFAAQLPFTLEEIDEIKVATSEAVSNCVIHGYPDSLGIVTLRADLVDGSLRLEVKDEGVGIADLAAAKEATFSTDPERMGLGLVFMESFMDEMHIESAPGRGTTVVMTKRPTSSAQENVNDRQSDHEL